jgi:hypothetical protein
LRSLTDILEQRYTETTRVSHALDRNARGFGRR